MASEEQLRNLHLELKMIAQFPPAQITEAYLKTLQTSNADAMRAIGLFRIASCPIFPQIPVIEADPDVLIDERPCIRVCPYLRSKG